MRAVAVIGGGIAGLACARYLADAGIAVRVFDQGRDPGGRTATRRHGDLRFDHGAQYFTARDERFAREVRSWVDAGVAARWGGRIGALENSRLGDAGSATRYVGVPGMSYLTRHLGADLEVRHGVRIETLERVAGGWRLETAAGVPAAGVPGDSFHAAVVAVPAPRAVALLAAVPSLQARVAAVEMSPCLAAMAAFAEPLRVPFDGAFVSSSPLAWAARNNSKPGRRSTECWVLHATPRWSARNFERPSEESARRLLDAFAAAVGHRLPTPVYLVGHRWRYARAQTPVGEDCLLDPRRRLAVCGDWCPGERIEGAFLSGIAAGRRLLPSLAGVRPGC